MFGNLFRNIPDVTKNLLILNVLFFLATIVLEGQGIYLKSMLGMHYPASPFFEPYQIITHFFMHGDFFHLLFNMIGLVVLGSHLERYWGKKRYLIFYLVTAFGAMILHVAVQGIEIYQHAHQLAPVLDVDWDSGAIYDNSPLTVDDVQFIGQIYVTPVLGASGAIYGLLMAFAMLFPNTEFMLLFPPIPIKAKWLALILGGIAVYQGFLNNPGDSVAHFAHLGGMLFGLILILIWKRDRTNFY